MAGLSDVYENKVQDFVWRQTDFTGASYIIISLHSGDPGEDGSANEITGDGMTREIIGSGGDTTFSDASGLFEIHNVGAIEFGQLSANKPNATHYGLWESDGTTFIGSGTIGGGIALVSGDKPTIAANVLSIVMPGGTGTNGYGKTFAGKMLNKIFRQGTLTPPANGWIAHFSADPGDEGASGEIAVGGYVRKQIGSGGVSTFSASSGGQTDNDSEIGTTASGADFPDVSHSALFDASTSGEMMMKWANTSTRSVKDGETIKFLAAGLSVTVD